MLELHQKQELQQKLSPQQIQYIKLLQLNTLDLEQRIKDEMAENPLLEEGVEDAELESREEAETEQEMENELETDDPDEEEFDLDELLNNPDDLYGYKANPNRGEDDDEYRRQMRASTSLAEDLNEQLSLLNLDEKEMLVADQIIGSIDEDGYLRREVESIIDDILFNQNVEVNEDEVEAVLKQVQSLDPAGIAARNLQECLLIQLRRMPPDIEGRDVAIEMLEDHYKAFTMKHFSKLKKRLDVDDRTLKTAFDLIQQRLDPKPGEGTFSEETNYITPDFTVRYVDNDFVITLNGQNAPDLRISRHYRRMLEKMRAEQKKDDDTSSVDQETKSFLKNKFESARWFINSINQRRHTMTLVMDAIVQLQEDFFRYGEGHLKPMILQDVADIIDMDISTVSRVVNGKYVQTEFGVYELKYFFSEGLETVDGEEVSNKEVKAILQQIVNDEDKTDPMSDQALADKLEERGFKIARRTVSKYRKQLGIPVARLRKEIVLDEEDA